MKRIYLSGAMTGYPDLNFPAFHAAAKALRERGLVVVNPAEIKPEGEPSWSACMRADLKAMLDCCTVALLPGWEDSKGANIEARLAINLGMRVVEIETLLAGGGMSLQCPLGKCQTPPIDTEAIKRDGWRDQGILVVAHDDSRLGWIEREQVRQIGSMLYGERKGTR